MEESVSKRNKGLWYLIWGMVFVIVFGLSAYVGYRLMGTKKLPAPNAPSGLTFSELPVVTPTIGPAKPVTVAVVSELDDVQLEAQVDSVALGEWWSILGVDSQALPLKELGGYNWYTPTRLTIVLKDIRPLSKEERWGLYKPTASGPEAEPVAGLATEFDATSPEEIAYQIYVAPEVLVEGRAAEEIEESVNRQLFEVLYEGAVGSTAMTPDDYQAKRERVFPAEGEGTRIIRLKSTNNPAGAQSTRPGRFANEIAGWLEARLAGVKHWQLVPKAQAQTCGGNWKCGANWNECKCGNGDTCLQANDGKSCGTGRGTCTCNPICVQETGSLNSCSASYGVCRPPGGGSGNCSQCLALNTCYNVGSGPTTAQVQPTSPPAGTDRCNVAGRVEYYNDNNLNASSIVKFKSENKNVNLNTGGSNGSGIFKYGAQYNSIWGTHFEVSVNNPYNSYRTFEVKGSVPSGCTATNGNKTIRCPNSVCFNRNANLISFNFEEVAPTPTPTPTVKPPICTDFTGPTSVSKGSTYGYEVKTRDPDKGTANGAGIGVVQLYWRYVGDTSWNKVSADEALAPYNFNLNTNDVAILSRQTSRKILLIANVYEPGCVDGDAKANCRTTGNPDAASTWTKSTACSKEVTVTESPVCSIGLPTLSTANTCSGSDKRTTVSWDAVKFCTQYEVQKATNAAFTANLSTNTTSGTSLTYSGLTRNIPHYFRARCKTKTASSSCTLPSTWSSVATATGCGANPTCDFTAGPTTIVAGRSGSFTATSNNASVLQMRYRQGTSGDWTSLATAQTGTNPSMTANFNCPSGAAGRSYQVICNAYEKPDWKGMTCEGDPSAAVSCGNDDLRTVTCTAPPTPSCSLDLNALDLNPRNTGTMTATVTSESEGTVNRVDFSSNNTGRVSVSPSSDTTRSNNRFSTTATANGNPGQNATITARGFINGVQRCNSRFRHRRSPPLSSPLLQPQ